MKGSDLTTLRRTEVFARGWGARASTTSLLDAQGATFDDFALQAFLGSVGLFWGNHLDESEAARFLGVRIKHDGAALNLAVFVEESRDIAFGETWSDASNEEVGAGVDCAFLIGIFHASVGRRGGTYESKSQLMSERCVIF